MAFVWFIGHEHQISGVVNLILIQHATFLGRPVVPLRTIRRAVAVHGPVIPDLIGHPQPNQHLDELAVLAGSDANALTNDYLGGLSRDLRAGRTAGLLASFPIPGWIRRCFAVG